MRNSTLAVAALALALVPLAGCKKKVVPPETTPEVTEAPAPAPE